jgi:prepilin-type N-terminal cleavage/methylation domain-containing protein
MASPSSDRGFTLLETIVATGILVTALAGVTQLFVLSTHLTRRATASGLALIAAQDKLESLRGLPFAYDVNAAAVTAQGLAPSLSTSLDEDVGGAVDWLDAAGQVVNNVDAAALVRRWKISTLAESPPDAIAIEVCVFKAPAGKVGPHAADACLATVRTRQP